MLSHAAGIWARKPSCASPPAACLIMAHYFSDHSPLLSTHDPNQLSPAPRATVTARCEPQMFPVKSDGKSNKILICSKMDKVKVYAACASNRISCSACSL